MDTLSAIQSLATVPMLDVDGGNWPLFKRKFKTHLQALGFENHFDAANAPAKTYDERPIKKDGETEEYFAIRSKEWTECEAEWKEEAGEGMEEGRCQGHEFPRKSSSEFALHGSL